MAVKLTEYLRDSNRDPDVRAVIITGTGDAFCAGLDMNDVKKRSEKPRLSEAPDSGGHPTQRVLRTYPLQISKPVICAINGSAGGFSAAYPLTCDIRNLMLSIEMALETSERGPVPYLEYTACEWGKNSALDSYYKLFLVTGGQLETF